jgi:hypothetical protein
MGMGYWRLLQFFEYLRFFPNTISWRTWPKADDTIEDFVLGKCEVL